jgi:UPF0755 protein
MARVISFFFWLILIAGAYLAYEAHRFLSTPASDKPADVIITIAPGATFDRVARDLKKAGAITDVARFRLLARYKDVLGKIRVGEYQLSTGWTPVQVLWQITQGQPVLYRLSIREGLSWWETAREVEAQGFATYEDFKAVIHDPDFLREHAIPFVNAEGFLYPETYMRSKPLALNKAQAREVASDMVNMFWKKTRPIWTRLPAKESADTALPSSSFFAGTVEEPGDCRPDALRRLVILASLVERETAVPEERARVAGVYANRLRINMPLQCDPTIIYGVGEGFTGSILKSQLNDAANPYNTYQHGGLPPGPICSPGLEALKAAATPEQHDFLYFVATGTDGGHSFSKTLTEHNRAVDAYRRR